MSWRKSSSRRGTQEGNKVKVFLQSIFGPFAVSEPKVNPSRVHFCSSVCRWLFYDAVSPGSELGLAASVPAPGPLAPVACQGGPPWGLPAPQACISECQTCPSFLSSSPFPFPLPLEDSKFELSLIPQIVHSPYWCILGKAFSTHQFLFTALNIYQVNLL